MITKLLLYSLMANVVLSGIENFFNELELNTFNIADADYNNSNLLSSHALINTTHFNTIDKNQIFKNSNQNHELNLSDIDVERTDIMIELEGNYKNLNYYDNERCSKKSFEPLNFHNNVILIPQYSSNSTCSTSYSETDTSKQQEYMDCTFYKNNETIAANDLHVSQNEISNENPDINDLFLSKISIEDLIPDIDVLKDNENTVVDFNSMFFQDTTFNVQNLHCNYFNFSDEYFENLPSCSYENKPEQDFSINLQTYLESNGKSALKSKNDSIKFYDVYKDYTAETSLRNDQFEIQDFNVEQNNLLNYNLINDENDQLQNKSIDSESETDFEEASKYLVKIVNNNDFDALSKLLQEQEFADPSNFDDLQITCEETTCANKKICKDETLILSNDGKFENEFLADQNQSKILYEIIDDLLIKDKKLKEVVENELDKLEIEEVNTIEVCGENINSLSNSNTIADILNNKIMQKKVISLKEDCLEQRKTFEKDISYLEKLYNDDDDDIEILEISSESVIEISSDEEINLCSDEENNIENNKQKK